MTSIGSAAIDVNAAMAKAAEVLEARYGDAAPRRIIVLGESMGGAAGIEALLAASAGEVKLDGGAVPTDVRGLFLNPFLDETDNVTNQVLEGVGRLPIVRDVAAPAAGVPVLTRDPEAARDLNRIALAGGTKARARTFPQADVGLRALRDNAARVTGPVPQMTFVIDSKDPLARPETGRTVAQQLGAPVVPLSDCNHVVSASPSKLTFLADQIDELARR